MTAAIRGGLPWRTINTPMGPPPVEPEAVTWPAPGPLKRSINHPDGMGWTVNLDAPPDVRDMWKTIGDWAAQRAIEDRMLEEMAAIVKSRPADAPGLILLRYPEETVIMESPWIPSGTLIYSCLDQPDLMVKIDPEDDRVLYYRQSSRKLNPG